MIFEPLTVSRGAQADAFSIEAPSHTVAHVKPFRGCAAYARLFAKAPELLTALDEIIDYAENETAALYECERRDGEECGAQAASDACERARTLIDTIKGIA